MTKQSFIMNIVRKIILEKNPMFNVFVAGAAFYGPKEKEDTSQLQKHPQLLWLPLFNSFFRYHVNADNQTSCSKYNKTYPERQGKVFEEIAGKTNANNVFTQITNNFSGELPSFFVKQMAHKQLLSLNSVGESSTGETTANVTGIDLLNNRAFRGNAFNFPIIPSNSILSNIHI